MIPRECLFVELERRKLILYGRLIPEGEQVHAQPILSIRASVPDASTVVGETTTTRAGEFRLELAVPVPFAIDLHVVDAAAAVVVRSRIELIAEQQATTIHVPSAALGGAVSITRDDTPPSLLVHDSIATLRTRVRTLVAEGQLETGAGETLEQALAPLTWTDGLMADARGVFAGDTAAAERLRAALLALGAPAELEEELEGHASEPGPIVDEHDREVERTSAYRVVDRPALAQLAAAVVWAVDDRSEIQSMLNGLAAVLWSTPWLELLLRAALTGASGQMKPLMGSVGPGWGLPPGLPVPMPGIPGGPGLPPGWGKVPKPKGGKIGALVPDFKVPINQMPSEEEKCLVGAMAAVAARKKALPQYEIRTIDNPRACPGDVVLLSGVNFGVSGSVRFPGKGDGVIATDVLQWSDTAIRVRVPGGAAPGIIRLSIYEGGLCLCGRWWPIYRLGRTLPLFDGGVPALLAFNVNGATSAITVEPGASVTVTFTTSVGAGVTARLVVRNGATVVFDSGSLPGGFHVVTFTAPDVRSPTNILAELSATNHCGSTVESVQIRVVKQPALRILQVEVTQAIQRFDNSVRLGARRRTMVRVYLDPGLNLFGFAGTPSSLPGITGSVTLWRDNQQLASVPPLNSPYTTIFTLFPAARQSLNGSLNFLLSTEHLSGDLRLDINVRLGTFPAGVIDGTNCTAARSVHVKFEALKKLSLVRIMLADDWRGLPAPTVAEWQLALQGAMTRFPVADDGWEIRIHPEYTVVTVDRDLSSEDGWDDVLEDLDDVAGDATDSWDHRWVGLLPAARPGVDKLSNLGMARRETTDRPWPLSNDYMVMACVAGRPDVFAHELGHTFDIGHANCPAGQPDDIDGTLPMFIEETGVDLYAMQPVATSAGELMGYCTSGGLWPSIVTWQRFVAGLD